MGIYGLNANEKLNSIRTEIMLDKMPSWMRLRDKESNTYQFLNFGPNITLDKLEEDIQRSFRNRFIQKADTEMMSASFKILLKDFMRKDNSEISFDVGEVLSFDNLIIKQKSKKIKLTINSLEFFTNKKEEMVFLDVLDEVLYFEKPYKPKDLKLKWEGITFVGNKKLLHHPIWNVFDEFGLLVGLRRLPREPNENFKDRILDVFRNPGNSAYEGLKNSITRELGLNKNDIDIIFLNDEKYKDSLFHVDNSPTRDMEFIIAEINKHFNIYWNNTEWDIGYWDSITKSGRGYSTLPTPVDYKEIKSNI